MMGMDQTLEPESTWMKTPAAKRPRYANQVEEALLTSPPPVVGHQTDTSWVNFIELSNNFQLLWDPQCLVIYHV